MSSAHRPSAEPFRTIIPVRENPLKLEVGQRILSLGSCFVENIGQRLRRFHFDIRENPSGVLYNPLSVAHALKRLCCGTVYEQAELFEHQGLWHSFDHHSRFSAPTPAQCLQQINAELERARDMLSRLDVLIVTFGTAWAYFRRDNGALVANCHRLPHDRFERRLLETEEMVTEWHALLSELFAGHEKLNVIATVSPVRHLRDDPHENTVSKARLITALHELESTFPQLYYFPSYEILLDELRDYRFYAPDMAHPSEQACDYIWDRFAAACLSSRAQSLVDHLRPIHKAMAHKIAAPDSPAGRAFAQRQLQKIEETGRLFPEVCIDEEKAHFAVQNAT